MISVLSMSNFLQIFRFFVLSPCICFRSFLIVNVLYDFMVSTKPQNHDVPVSKTEQRLPPPSLQFSHLKLPMNPCPRALCLTSCSRTCIIVDYIRPTTASTPAHTPLSRMPIAYMKLQRSAFEFPSGMPYLVSLCL